MDVIVETVMAPVYFVESVSYTHLDVYKRQVLANALQRQGINGKKERQLAESCDEYNAALALRPDLTTMRYSLGVSLAYLHRDEEARKEFSAFLDQDRMSPELHDRVKRFVGRRCV